MEINSLNIRNLKPYKHIFFDLDHTLWDFETNAAETLEEIYSFFGLKDKGVASASGFINMYKSINEKMWDDYEKRRISKEYLRTRRYYKTLLSFGIDDKKLSEKIGEFYVAESPKKTNLFPHAIETLSYLAEKYKMHIITNGFVEVQYLKLKNSGLKNYFEKIIISEEAGSNKPEKKIFRYALTGAGAKKQESIMVGDNLDADIIGAKNSGLDQCFFNPLKRAHNEKITYEISSLDELQKIL